MNRHIKYPLKTSFNFCVNLGLRWYNLHLEQKEGNKEGGGVERGEWTKQALFSQESKKKHHELHQGKESEVDSSVRVRK